MQNHRKSGKFDTISGNDLAEAMIIRQIKIKHIEQ